jgi:hypothetical protein
MVYAWPTLFFDEERAHLFGVRTVDLRPPGAATFEGPR